MGIKFKGSNVAGKAPVVADLGDRELAINTADGKLFASNGSKILEIGRSVNPYDDTLAYNKGDQFVDTSGWFEADKDYVAGAAMVLPVIVEPIMDPATHVFRTTVDVNPGEYVHFTVPLGPTTLEGWTKCTNLFPANTDTPFMVKDAYFDTSITLSSAPPKIPNPALIQLDKFGPIVRSDDGHGYTFADKASNPMGVGSIDLSPGGDGTTGTSSVAIGGQATASGSRAIAIGGALTEANGDGSVAIGQASVADGRGSYAIGFFAKADNENQIALGKMNIGTDPDTVVEIGVGLTSTDRKNGLEIYKDGKIRAPELTLAGHDDPSSLTTKEYVDSVVGGGGTAAWKEPLAVAQADTTVTFTNDVSGATVKIFLNGTLLLEVDDYTVDATGKILTFVKAATIGGKIIAYSA